ncbi:MAG: HAMP domain-containing histidine kinase, partial [Anaerolineae bacterium]|nr:HAMP domain-containing histidine kinase [Anaerolineae bacterium]
IFKEDPVTGKTLEPIEEVHVEVADDMAGIVIELLGSRRGNMMDMYSEHRQLEQQLRKTVEELETFNHTVAHELKNPLASVLGFSGLIKQQFVRQSTSDLQYYVEQIEESVHDMTGMITNLLYLAQIQDTNHAFEPIDVTLVVKKALRRFERQIEKQHITVTVAADLPAALGHETWLEEVFANFISNAIKYMGSDNPVPEIHIGGSKNDDMLRYWVQDTGIGITPEDQAAIFEKYARVEKSVEGIGLGLPIVRHIITRLGGNVGVESEPGKGSTFWFTLPTPERT